MSPKTSALRYEELKEETQMDLEFAPELSLIIAKRLDPKRDPISISGSITVSF